MFTTDFYLPEHDLYIELTTMKQSLVTPKNRFFFQAEDGIRDVAVTGVQTCALPICPPASVRSNSSSICAARVRASRRDRQIGRASCRERGEISVGAVSLKKKKK